MCSLFKNKRLWRFRNVWKDFYLSKKYVLYRVPAAGIKRYILQEKIKSVSFRNGTWLLHSCITKTFLDKMLSAVHFDLNSLTFTTLLAK